MPVSYMCPFNKSVAGGTINMANLARVMETTSAVVQIRWVTICLPSISGLAGVPSMSQLECIIHAHCSMMISSSVGGAMLTANLARVMGTTSAGIQMRWGTICPLLVLGPGGSPSILQLILAGIIHVHCLMMIPSSAGGAMVRANLARVIGATSAVVQIRWVTIYHPSIWGPAGVSSL